jgi:hypothetical protein
MLVACWHLLRSRQERQSRTVAEPEHSGTVSRIRHRERGWQKAGKKLSTIGEARSVVKGRSTRDDATSRVCPYRAWRLVVTVPTLGYEG